MFFFTADTHFCHDNILTWSQRPFKTVEEMNDAIVRNWNQRVKTSDTVFHLGDFCWDEKRFDEFMTRLNGRIILIKGNHDKGNRSILTEATIEFGGHEWKLIHDSEFASHNFVLCGHVHELWKTKSHGAQLLVNVGVDVWGFKPITINEILATVVRETSNGTALCWASFYGETHEICLLKKGHQGKHTNSLGTVSWGKEETK